MKTEDAVRDAQKIPPKKSYQLILSQQIDEGLAELERPAYGLFLSGLSAGMDLGFSVLMMCVMFSHVQGVVPEAIAHLMVSNMYALGFIFVILGRSELFTEHTNLAFHPVMDGKASLLSLLRLWGIIYVANIIGGAVFAYLINMVGPALNIIKDEAFIYFAEKMVGPEWHGILLSGVLAGWLMGLLSWMVTAGRDSISQVLFVWLITSTIGMAELHHCIAGAIEVLTAIFASNTVGFGEFLHFLFWTTAGNVIGGVFFVAILKYGHVTRSKD